MDGPEHRWRKRIDARAERRRARRQISNEQLFKAICAMQEMIARQEAGMEKLSPLQQQQAIARRAHHSNISGLGSMFGGLGGRL